MPISRKTLAPQTGLAAKLRPKLMPRRIVIYIVIRDESGSMRTWRQKQGEFIPGVAGHLIEVGGPKVGKLIYILYCVISGGVWMGEFISLDQAVDPTFEPDGQTPIGKGLSAVAAKIKEFITWVLEDEVTIRNFEILVISDLKATGETPEETASGVEAFIDVARKYRAKVNLVGPDPEEMNHELAARLDISERGVKYLDSDPKSILQITFASLLGASRTAFGGSNPTIQSL